MTDQKGVFGAITAKFSNPFKAEPESWPEGGPIPDNIPKRPYARPEWHSMPPAWIKYKGIFDLEGLYRLMVRWFKDRKFEFYETLHKAKPPELELVWTAERKKTGYIKEIIDVYFHMWDVFDVEVIEDGKKKMLTKARMSISITPKILTAYPDAFGQKKWNSELERKFMYIFNHYIFKTELDQMYDDVLYYESYKLHTDIKKFLGMVTEGNAYG